MANKLKKLKYETLYNITKALSKNKNNGTQKQNKSNSATNSNQRAPRRGDPMWSPVSNNSTSKQNAPRRGDPVWSPVSNSSTLKQNAPAALPSSNLPQYSNLRQSKNGRPHRVAPTQYENNQNYSNPQSGALPSETTTSNNSTLKQNAPRRGDPVWSPVSNSSTLKQNAPAALPSSNNSTLKQDAPREGRALSWSPVSKSSSSSPSAPYTNLKTASVKQPVKYDGANASVRAQMNNMGLDNSKIGWDNGYVTYDNKYALKPASVKDGVSYAPVSDIQTLVDEVYKGQGKNPVRITDYAAPAGLGGISYSENGRVAVGGENIPVLYMDGDRAVMDSNDLDAAYAGLLNRTGVKTAQELYDEWNKSYKNAVDEAYNKMADYEKWSYNPETDPSYQAYKNMYEREGERAYRDAAAKIASKNNGNMTSAAQTLANAQLAYYMSMLADRIPELQQNSYERYADGYNRAKQNYETLKNRAESDWTRINEANNTAKADYQNWQKEERERTTNAQADALYQLELQNDKNKNEQAVLDYAWENAEKRGYFTDTEAKLLNIPKNAYGEYLTPNDIKIKNDTQYFNEVSKPQQTFKNYAELEQAIKELERKYALEENLKMREIVAQAAARK